MSTDAFVFCHYCLLDSLQPIWLLWPPNPKINKTLSLYKSSVCSPLISPRWLWCPKIPSQQQQFVSTQASLLSQLVFTAFTCLVFKHKNIAFSFQWAKNSFLSLSDTRLKKYNCNTSLLSFDFKSFLFFCVQHPTGFAYMVVHVNVYRSLEQLLLWHKKWG